MAPQGARIVGGAARGSVAGNGKNPAPDTRLQPRLDLFLVAGFGRFPVSTLSNEWAGNGIDANGSIVPIDAGRLAGSLLADICSERGRGRVHIVVS